MLELRCPQCGTPHTVRQSFCGDCGYALQAGVTRPLPSGSPLAVAARVASVEGVARRGREAPLGRRLIMQGVPLLVGLIVLVLGLLWLRGGPGLDQLGAPP